MTRTELFEPSGSETENTTIGQRTDLSDRTKILADLVDEVGWHQRVTKTIVEDGKRIHEEAGRLKDELSVRLLRLRTSEKTQHEVLTLLRDLNRLGFSWSDLARVFGVSVPALRKWRLGEAASADNRMKVASLAALCELLPERNPMIQDPAAWLEMPLVAGVPISGLDLLAAGRSDLILRYGEGDDPDLILDEFSPSWRQEFTSDVVVVTGPDGLPALTTRD